MLLPPISNKSHIEGTQFKESHSTLILSFINVVCEESAAHTEIAELGSDLF